MKATAAPTNNGIKGIEDAFSAAKQRGRATLIPYICAGYDQATKTVDILLAMQKGGALAPCLNPFADGDTIKESHKIAINNGTTGMRDCLRILETAHHSHGVLFKLGRRVQLRC